MKTVALIGHVDHGKTILTALTAAKINQLADVNILQAEPKTINEIIEEERSIKITAPVDYITPCEIKSGRENRRERRARERKTNKK